MHPCGANRTAACIATLVIILVRSKKKKEKEVRRVKTNITNNSSTYCAQLPSHTITRNTQNVSREPSPPIGRRIKCERQKQNGTAGGVAFLSVYDEWLSFSLGPPAPPPIKSLMTPPALVVPRHLQLVLLTFRKEKKKGQ